jgi:hypothetical protein
MVGGRRWSALLQLLMAGQGLVAAGAPRPHQTRASNPRNRVGGGGSGAGCPPATTRRLPPHSCYHSSDMKGGGLCSTGTLRTATRIMCESMAWSRRRPRMRTSTPTASALPPTLWEGSAARRRSAGPTGGGCCSWSPSAGRGGSGSSRRGMQRMLRSAAIANGVSENG